MSQKSLMHSSSAAVPYFILLFLLMMSCSGGWAVHAAGAKGGDVESIKFFGEALIEDPQHGELRMFAAPSLVDVNGMLVGFAQSVSAKEDKLVCNASAKFTEKKTHEWETLKELSNWETTGSIVTRNATTESFFYYYPTSAAKGNRVYVLVTKLKPDVGDPGSSDQDTMDTQLIVGESTEGQSKMTINWKPPVSLTDTLAGELKGIGKLLVGGGSGIVTSEGYIVLPVMVMTSDSKSFMAVIYSPDGEVTNWKISRVTMIQGCSYHSIVEPEAGKLLIMASCDGNRRKVFESSDMGETWTEASATLSCVWQNLPFIATHPPPYVGLTAATLQEGDNNKKVMLLTVPVHSVNEEASESQLHLWMSDAENRHIYDVGPVSAAGEGTIASDLLYTPDGRLFSLYEVYPMRLESFPIVGIQLAHLTGKLDQVKSVLRTWEEVDRRVSAPCNAAGHTGGGKTCSTPMPTSGLVGFLSGNATENEWRDEYLCVDARVTGETVKNTNDGGLTFQGSGSWAEWPVSNQGQTQRYHFANYNFILMTTVAIHSEPTEAAGSIPLMGVKLNDVTDEKKTLMGLSYTADNKWEVTLNGEKKTTTQGEKTWELNKEYQVTLILRDGNKGSVYIDGERLGNEGADLKMDDGTISHFYIGGDGQGSTGSADSSNRVSVKNVLLYNRPLTDEEISTPKVKGTPVSQPSGSGHPTSQTSVETSTNVFTNGSLKTSMPRGDNSDCVHVSGVLLLFFLSLGLLGTVV